MSRLHEKKCWPVVAATSEKVKRGGGRSSTELVNTSAAAVDCTLLRCSNGMCGTP